MRAIALGLSIALLGGAAFTWGEQGHLPGLGSRHSNVTTSFLVIGRGGTGR